MFPCATKGAICTLNYFLSTGRAVTRYFDILCANAHPQIIQRNNVRIEPAGILYMYDNIFAPMPSYQRAICAHRIAMIFRRVMINDPCVRKGCPFFRRISLVNQWSRKDMSPAGPKRACDFPESRRSVKNTLKNILSNNKVESAVGKCLLFEVLAAVTSAWMSISKTQLRIVLRRRIESALLG